MKIFGWRENNFIDVNKDTKNSQKTQEEERILHANSRRRVDGQRLPEFGVHAR